MPWCLAVPRRRARRVCKAWREAAEQEAPWAARRRNDMPTAEEATVAVLTQRAQGRRCCASKHVYRQLLQPWVCDRCHEVRGLRVSGGRDGVRGAGGAC